MCANFEQQIRDQFFYNLYTDNFKVWIEDKFDYMERRQYLELVLFPECLIKIYMTLFSFVKEEAERRIFNTPFRKGEDSYSSDDEK